MTERIKCDCGIVQDDGNECVCTPEKIRGKTEWLLKAMQEPNSTENIKAITDKIAETETIGSIVRVKKFHFSLMDEIRSNIIKTHKRLGGKLSPIREIVVFASKEHFNAISEGLKKKSISKGVFRNEHLNKNEKQYQEPGITFYRDRVNHYVYKIDHLKHSLFVPIVIDLGPEFCLVLK